MSDKKKEKKKSVLKLLLKCWFWGSGSNIVYATTSASFLYPPPKYREKIRALM